MNKYMEKLLKGCFNHMNNRQHYLQFGLPRVLSSKIQQNVESTHRHEDPNSHFLRGFQHLAEPTKRFNFDDVGLLKSISGCHTSGKKCRTLDHDLCSLPIPCLGAGTLRRSCTELTRGFGGEKNK